MDKRIFAPEPGTPGSPASSTQPSSPANASSVAHVNHAYKHHQQKHVAFAQQHLSIDASASSSRESDGKVPERVGVRSFDQDEEGEQGADDGGENTTTATSSSSGARAIPGAAVWSYSHDDDDGEEDHRYHHQHQNNNNTFLSSDDEVAENDDAQVPSLVELDLHPPEAAMDDLVDSFLSLAQILVGGQEAQSARAIQSLRVSMLERGELPEKMDALVGQVSRDMANAIGSRTRCGSSRRDSSAMSPSSSSRHRAAIHNARRRRGSDMINSLDGSGIISSESSCSGRSPRRSDGAAAGAETMDLGSMFPHEDDGHGAADLTPPTSTRRHAITPPSSSSVGSCESGGGGARGSTAPESGRRGIPGAAAAGGAVLVGMCAARDLDVNPYENSASGNSLPTVASSVKGLRQLRQHSHSPNRQRIGGNDHTRNASLLSDSTGNTSSNANFFRTDSFTSVASSFASTAALGASTILESAGSFDSSSAPPTKAPFRTHHTTGRKIDRKDVAQELRAVCETLVKVKQQLAEAKEAIKMAAPVVCSGDVSREALLRLSMSGGGGESPKSRSPVSPKNQQKPSFDLVEKQQQQQQKQSAQAPVKKKAAAGHSVASLTDFPTIGQTNKLDRSSNSATVNQYRLLRELGRGSEGVVYLAVDTTVAASGSAPAAYRAIKCIRRPNAYLDDPARFVRKAEMLRHQMQVLQAIHHAGVVALHEVVDDPDADHLYLVLDYVSGGAASSPRSDIVGAFSRRFDWQTVAHLGRRLCAALEYMQSKNIIHADIKCENILVYDTTAEERNQEEDQQKQQQQKNPFTITLEPRLADFGFGRVVAARDGDDLKGPSLIAETNSNAVPGTMAFRAPELLATVTSMGRAGSPAAAAATSDEQMIKSDVWSLGLSLYTLLYGRLPWPGNDARSYISNVKKMDVPFPPAWSPFSGEDERERRHAERRQDKAAPGALTDIIAGMLRREPLQRSTARTARLAFRLLDLRAEEHRKEKFEKKRKLQEEQKKQQKEEAAEQQQQQDRKEDEESVGSASPMSSPSMASLQQNFGDGEDEVSSPVRGACAVANGDCAADGKHLFVPRRK